MYHSNSQRSSHHRRNSAGGHSKHGHSHNPPPPVQPVGYMGSQQSHVYGHRQPSGPGVLNSRQTELLHWFSTVDTDRSGQITLAKLQAALVNGDWTRFDLDTVKMLMGMFDQDRNGTIGFDEFEALWKYIEEWRNAFTAFDKDRSGTIEGGELSEALGRFGHSLSPTILALIEQKYASAHSGEYGPPPGITFDRFIRACVVVERLTKAFDALDNDHDGWIQISYEQFMKIVLKSP